MGVGDNMKEEAKAHCHASLFNDCIDQFFRRNIKPNDRWIVLFRSSSAKIPIVLLRSSFTYSEHLHLSPSCSSHSELASLPVAKVCLNPFLNLRACLFSQLRLSTYSVGDIVFFPISYETLLSVIEEKKLLLLLRPECNHFWCFLCHSNLCIDFEETPALSVLQKCWVSLYSPVWRGMPSIMTFLYYSLLRRQYNSMELLLQEPLLRSPLFLLQREDFTKCHCQTTG